MIVGLFYAMYAYIGIMIIGIVLSVAFTVFCLLLAGFLKIIVLILTLFEAKDEKEDNNKYDDYDDYEDDDY